MIFDNFAHNDNVAVISDRGERLRYSDIDCFIKEMKAKLQPRSLAFCLCNNEVGSLLGYISFLRLGVVPVMLDATKDVDSVKTLLNIYKPQYIWTPSSMIEKYIGFDILFQRHNYSLIQYSTENIVLHPDLALLLTTSGSTGSPKFVRLTQKNILSNAESIAAYLQIDENERAITMLPMYYSFGLSIINSHLIKGATLLLTDKTYAQREFWTFLKENNATSMSGVPYTWEMLKRLRFFRMDLPRVRTMTQAGGKLNADLALEYIQNAKQQGKKFIVMYGQTEATARMSYLPWDMAEEKYASIGIAIPGGRFELAEDGELIYYGPNVSMGYAECAADLMKGNENNGCLHTGDIARVDEDGFYYITGRKKRFVKVFGNRVNLDATEQILKSAGFNCAVVGVDDKITIFVVDGNVEQSIKDLLLQKTGLNTRAFDVKEIESIPKNASGKVQYAELMKLL